MDVISQSGGQLVTEKRKMIIQSGDFDGGAARLRDHGSYGRGRPAGLGHNGPGCIHHIHLAMPGMIDRVDAAK